MKEGVGALVVPQPNRVVCGSAEHLGEVGVEGEGPDGVGVALELSQVVVHSYSMTIIGIEGGRGKVPHAHQAIPSCGQHPSPIRS